MTEQTKIALASIGFAAAAWLIGSFAGVLPAGAAEANDPTNQRICGIVSTQSGHDTFIYNVMADQHENENELAEDADNVKYGNNYTPENETEELLVNNRIVMDKLFLMMAHECPKMLNEGK